MARVCWLLLCFLAASYTITSVYFVQRDPLASIASLNQQQDALTQALSSTAAAKFTLYPNIQGHCSSGLIYSHGPSLGVHEIMLQCLSNANCTFFTYSKAGGGQVCSGRVGDSPTGGIVADGSNIAAGWLSGDRKGCEAYTVEQAAAASAYGLQPVCHRNQPKGCPYYSARGTCITDLLNYDNEAYTLLDGDSESAICEVNEATVLAPVESMSRQGCQWQPSNDKHDYVNMHSQHHLLGDNLAYHAGLLTLTDSCLCDNDKYGLMIGPFCPNADCQWDYANSTCLFRSRLNKRCLTELNRDVQQRPASQCLCEYDEGNYATRNGSFECDRPECKWKVVKGQQVNMATGMVIGATLEYQLDGTLLAHRRQCLCDNDGMLRTQQQCDSVSCKWERADGPAVDQTDTHFDIMRGTKVQCVATLLPVQHTASLQEALQLCLEEEQCTALVHHPGSGATLICKGHYKDPDIISMGARKWTSAVRKGCAFYTEQASFSGLADYNTLPCHARRADVCEACPAGLFQTAGCSVNKPATCDTSSHGFSGQWPGSQSVGGFEEPMQDLARRMGEEGIAAYKSFNPSIFQWNDDLYAVFRMANNTLCGKDMFGRQEGQVYMSRLGLCKLDPATIIPTECRELRYAVDQILAAASFMKVHSVFKGLEDPRAFIYNGKVYVSATINLEHKNSIKTGFTEQRMAVLLLDDNLQSIVEAVILRQSYLPGVLTQKNWSPLVHNNELYFVVNIMPLHIVHPDLRTGQCELVVASRLPVSERRKLARTTAGEPLRGGTPFIKTPWGYMAFAHRRKEYALGPIYTHHVVIVDSNAQGTFHVKWMSPGFRLPNIEDNGHAHQQGVQFASGAFLGHEKLYVSYGVGDCHAALAQMPLFSNSPYWSSAPYSTLPEPVLANEKPKVRWEGIAAGHASFTVVMHEMVPRMQARAPQIQFEVLDLSGKSAQTNVDDMDNQLIATNEQLNSPPEVLIRLHWPVNNHKPMARYWIQYLPWEFETIPDEWVQALNANASEVWAPSNYVRNGFIASGLDPNKVFVVPHGVSNQYCNDTMTKGINVTATLPFMHRAKKFKFLYQGGALWRKGLDILLEAYALHFKASDDITLVIHVNYGDPEVIDMLAAKFQEFQRHADKPQIIPVGDVLTEEQNMVLYKSVDAYVHPARAEGYGMTIIQAMAAARPVIVPSVGGHTDFADSSNAYVAPALVVPCDKHPCHTTHDGTMSIFSWKVLSQPRWAEIDAMQLGRLLRHVYSHPKERAVIAQQGRQDVCSKVTWDQAAQLAVSRIHALLPHLSSNSL